MTLLDKAGISFFKAELTKDTQRQIAMFETDPPDDLAIREIGRIRLYEEKVKIEHHFAISEPDKACFESHHPHHGLLSKVAGLDSSSSLVWAEIDGLRHSVRGSVETELRWNGETPPKVRLTRDGKFEKKAVL